MSVQNFVGIDVSKDDFYACFDEGEAAQQYPNTKGGISRLLLVLQQKQYHPADTKIGIESTGAYYYRLSFDCTNKGYTVNIINPLITAGQNKATVRKTKNDKKDAALIRYVLTQGHGYPFVETKATLILKNLVRTRSYLSDLKRNIQRRAADVSYKEAIIKEPITMLNQEVFAMLAQKIKQLDQELRQHDKPTQTLLQTIPGLGPTTSAALIAELTDITRFPSSKQLTAFLGLDPRTYESGTSIHGKGYITKRGNTLLRTLIYNCTAVAIQRPNIFRTYYTAKVSAGKPKMIALVATMHKLVRVIYAVWSKGAPYCEKEAGS